MKSFIKISWVYVAMKGGAEIFLHFGRKVTPEISLRLQFGEGDVTNAYKVVLRAADDDGLIVQEERAYCHEPKYARPYERPISGTFKEPNLDPARHRGESQILQDLESYRVYHFHDTPDSAAVKATCDVKDNRVLRLKRKI